jgi:hypothetical protein
MLTLGTAGMMLDGASDNANEDPNAALAILHTHTVDALKGFEKMVEKAEPEFRRVAQRFHDLHERHARELADHLTARVRTVDADGSFMGTINETVVGLRAFFDEIDEGVMGSIRSGEGHVLKAFDAVLKSSPDGDHLAEITRMRAELTELLHDTRHLD